MSALDKKCDLFWSAPTSFSSVDVVIVLSCDTILHSLALYVDNLGYSVDDVLMISVSGAKTFPDWYPIGLWDLRDHLQGKKANQSKIILSIL